MDCVLSPTGTRGYCPRCDPKHKRPIPIGARRNCHKPPTAAELATAARALGITATRKHRHRLARLVAAGLPVRSEAEQARLRTAHCEPCDCRLDGNCHDGKCIGSRAPIAVRLADATDHCRDWTEDPEAFTQRVKTNGGPEPGTVYHSGKDK